MGHLVLAALVLLGCGYVGVFIYSAWWRRTPAGRAEWAKVQANNVLSHARFQMRRAADEQRAGWKDWRL